MQSLAVAPHAVASAPPRLARSSPNSRNASPICCATCCIKRAARASSSERLADGGRGEEAVAEEAGTAEEAELEVAVEEAQAPAEAAEAAVE